VAALGTLGAMVAIERLSDDQRLPGSKFMFENGFEGVYCLAISPEHPAAPVDVEGFAVYTFDGRGIARSSTFPSGKGAINRAVSVDRQLNMTHPLDNRIPCGTLAFGDQAVLLGVVGSANCPKYDAARPPSFDEAVALYCK
jgi:hypothetical protein